VGFERQIFRIDAQIGEHRAILDVGPHRGASTHVPLAMRYHE
jgi:hypothetical protein